MSDPIKKTYDLHHTRILGCFCIQPFQVEDNRGAFTKFWNKPDFFTKSKSVEFTPKEIFTTYNKDKRTLRGMHFQLVKEQAKLVFCPHGAIRDVVVDLRPESPSFMQHVILQLEGKVGSVGVFVPKGCAHGYETLVDDTTVIYIADNEFYAEGDAVINPFDADIKIPWLHPADKYIMSQKDRLAQSYKEFEARGGLQYGLPSR